MTQTEEGGGLKDAPLKVKKSNKTYGAQGGAVTVFGG